MVQVLLRGMIVPMELPIRSYTGGMVQTNSYLIGEGEQCVLVDAPLGVAKWVDGLGVLPSDLLLTHQHYDHVEDVAKLAAMGLRVHAYAPHSEDLTLENLLKMQGVAVSVPSYKVDNLLEGKTMIEVGGVHFSIEHVPGHSPDSVAFVAVNCAFVGDTLFAGSVGRADLPGGDMDLLIRGIHDKLLTLADDTRVFPGHGPETSIGAERAGNSFL